MAYIYLPKKKDNRPKRGRSARGHKFYMSRRWRSLRQQQLMLQPCCEWCLYIKGIISPATQVHHLVKFNSVTDENEQRKLFEDPDNHFSVCTENGCHHALDNDLYEVSNLIYHMRKKGLDDEEIVKRIKNNI